MLRSIFRVFGKFSTLKRFFLTFGVLLIVNTVFGLFFQFLQDIEYFHGKSVARIISDLAFVEASVIFFIGAVSAFYFTGFCRRDLKFFAFSALLFVVSIVFGAVG